MKRLIAIVIALCFVGLIVPTNTPAQDVDVHVKVRSKQPVATAPRVAYEPKVSYEPKVVYEPKVSYEPVIVGGSGCYGSRMQEGGCISKSAGGCYGQTAGSGCFGSNGSVRYGTPIGNGKYATPSGKPAPPGALPWNGPFVGLWREASGYDRHYSR